MGIRYGEDGIVCTRLFDFKLRVNGEATRIYSLLDYARFTLLVFGDREVPLDLPAHVKVIRIRARDAERCPYADRQLLVRPDGYVAEDAFELRHPVETH